MSLLNEIIHDVIYSDADVSQLLRKCRLLASEIESQALKEWVLKELNGYSNDDEIPEYRQLNTQIKGDFSGPFGSGLTNAPIPSACIPEEFEEYVIDYKARQSITGIEGLCKSENPTFVVTIDANILPRLEVYQHMICRNAWLVLARGQIEGLIGAIKNRILEFALELKEQYPELSRQDGKLDKGESEKVTQIVNNIFYGGQANQAYQSSEFRQVSIQNIMEGDKEALEAFLLSLGLPEEETSDILLAIEEEPKPSQKSPEPKLTKALEKAMVTLSGGAASVGAGAAGQLLAEAVARYYGWK